MGRLRTVSYAPAGVLAGKAMFTIAVQDVLGRCDSLAFEYPGDEPGVIRWEVGYQCVPMFICEGMGWKDLRAQQQALERKARVLQTLQDLTEECDQYDR